MAHHPNGLKYNLLLLSVRRAKGMLIYCDIDIYRDQKIRVLAM